MYTTIDYIICDICVDASKKNDVRYNTNCYLCCSPDKGRTCTISYEARNSLLELFEHNVEYTIYVTFGVGSRGLDWVDDIESIRVYT